MAFSWTTTGVGELIYASHFTEIINNINYLYDYLGVTRWSWTFTPTIGNLIYASHIEEIKDAVDNLDPHNTCSTDKTSHESSYCSTYYPTHNPGLDSSVCPEHHSGLNSGVLAGELSTHNDPVLTDHNDGVLDGHYDDANEGHYLSDDAGYLSDKLSYYYDGQKTDVKVPHNTDAFSGDDGTHREGHYSLNRGSHLSGYKNGVHTNYNTSKISCTTHYMEDWSIRNLRRFRYPSDNDWRYTCEWDAFGCKTLDDYGTGCQWETSSCPSYLSGYYRDHETYKRL